MFKAFVKIKRSHKSVILYPKSFFFAYVCATCFELPSNISTMDRSVIFLGMISNYFLYGPESDNKFDRDPKPKQNL